MLKRLLLDFKNNAVAFISLLIAVTALLYTGWREERTERNRTLRVAAFEVLKNLGELQVVVNSSFYQKGSEKSSPMEGWGHIALIGDLGQLLPEPIPHKLKELLEVWKNSWSQISSNEASVDQVTEKIDESRQSISKLLRTLH